MDRHQIKNRHLLKLLAASAVVSCITILVIYGVKLVTEHLEEILFDWLVSRSALLFIITPTIGITAIYFLRKYAFKGRKNKGITEIYKTLDQRKEHLPFFKIPSHLLNGMLTVIFGGSTGIEVSSVVASATVGNQIHIRNFAANQYKRELVCAGVTAAVAILFVSPVAGMLFALEVISRKVRSTLLLSCGTAALLSWLFIHVAGLEPLLAFEDFTWNWHAMPGFIILSLLGALLSVYFTLLVTRMKKLFGNINNNFIRVNTGAIAVGVALCVFPALYGDSYHGMQGAMTATGISLGTLAILALLKPLAASLTLGAGGDGGVFAPSIVAGAFLGLLVAKAGNIYFDLNLIPLNFALVGAAATLSASIYAPFTALILVCGLAPGGFQLFVPVLMGCIIARYFAQKVLPYNVYTYDFYLNTQALKKTD